MNLLHSKSNQILVLIQSRIIWTHYTLLKFCAARFFLQSMGLCIRAATTTRPIYIFSCLIIRVAYRQWTNLCCFCSTRFCVSLHLFIAILSNGIAKQHYLIHVYRSFDTKNAENLYCSCKKNYCPVWKIWQNATYKLSTIS